MKIQDKIKQRRTQLNLTLEEVANVVGVTKATVQRWESGLIANMKRDKIVLLAKALKTSPAYILGLNKSAEEFNQNESHPLLNNFPPEISQNLLKNSFIFTSTFSRFLGRSLLAENLDMGGNTFARAVPVVCT